jgi:hypothetical protein
VSQPLPEEVRKLLRDQVRSIEQLEILLLLREHSDRTWTPAEMYQQIRSSERSVGDALDRLCRDGLAVRREAPQNGYQYAPATAALRAAVDMLALQYAERRVRIVEEIYSERVSDVGEFAKAFRFRKERPNG